MKDLQKELLKFNIYQKELNLQGKTNIKEEDYIKFIQLKNVYKDTNKKKPY